LYFIGGKKEGRRTFIEQQRKRGSNERRENKPDQINA